MQDESLQVRPSGSPTRCPFCHTEVDREQAGWVACHACLAPHHADCWSEGGACAGCGETRCVGEGAAVEAAEAGAAPAVPRADAVPVLEVELRGRTAHVECPASLEIEVQPGLEPELELRLQNLTSSPQQISLANRPPWLELEGPAKLELTPGKPTVVRARVRDAALLRRVRWAQQPTKGRLVLAIGANRRAVELALCLHPRAVRARSRRFGLLAALAAVVFMTLGGLVTRARSARIAALSTHGVTTQAVVTRRTPHNHDQMYYEYEVHGVRYEDHDFANGQQVGDKLEVTYLPEDPTIAVRGRAYDSVSGPAALIAPMLASMFALVGCALLGLQPWLRQLGGGGRRR